MPAQNKNLPGSVIVVSDRIKSGERIDKAGPAAVDLLQESGVEISTFTVVGEGFEPVHQ